MSEEKKSNYDLNKELFEKFKYVHLEKKPEGKLTKEQQAMEIIKCKYNILYYLENYAMIPLPGGGSTKLEINDKLRAVALLYQASVIHIFQTSRQSSKTTIQLCCASWYINFWENVKILFFNMKASDNKKNLLEIKKMVALMPKWMRSYDPKRDPNNVEKFRNGIQSEIILMSIDKQNPDATGRGNTGAIYLDEFGFLHNIHIAHTPLSFVYSNYARISNNNYVPAPYAITSTPADPMTAEGELFQSLWEKAFEINYSDIKDMLPHEIKKYVEKNSESNIAKVYQFWYEYPDRCEKELYNPENEDNILHLLTDPFVDISELTEYSEKAANYLKAVRILCKTKTQLRREVNSIASNKMKILFRNKVNCWNVLRA